MLVKYRQNQAELTEAPPALLPNLRPDLDAIKSIVKTALAAGREMLTELEAKAVLDACRIAIVPTKRVAGTPDAAAQAAQTVWF